MKWEIIKKFSSKNRCCFRYKEVVGEFQEMDRSYLSKVLSAMVSMGMLMKVDRDLYCIIPLSENPETYVPDSRVLAKCIMNEKGYYIAYASAMDIHGLTEQAGPRTMVATKRQKQPARKCIRGLDFQYIYHNNRKFFGYQDIWINQQEQVLVSDLEKTIADAVSIPQLCGGIPGLGKALNRSRERINLQKLFYYLARNGSHAAKKRYLFLSYFLELKWTTEHERMLADSGAGISLLDPANPERGRKNSRFGLSINVDLSSLRKSLQTW